MLLRSDHCTKYQHHHSGEYLKVSNSSVIRNGKETFYGICIDTGASFHSVAGFDQYFALSKIQNIIIDTSTVGFVHATFGKGSASSIGSINISIPFGVFTFHILHADIPFLLSLHDMDQHGIVFNNLKDTLTQPSTGLKMQVYRNKGHAWIYPEDPNPKISIINNFSELDTYVSESLLSESELRRLHRRFGHPSASKLINLLQRAGYADNLNNKTIEKPTP